VFYRGRELQCPAENVYGQSYDGRGAQSWHLELSLATLYTGQQMARASSYHHGGDLLRRITLPALCCLLAVWTACSLAPQSGVLEARHDASGLQTEPAITRIAFGSCNREWRPQPLWDPILATQPDLWIWLGDNIYADTQGMEAMRQKYAIQLANAGYQRLRAGVPIIGTWDDHDYGANNSGKEYPHKAESQQSYLTSSTCP
jgi:hypothetical protein